ncbi:MULTISPECIES: DUF4365 domain-containing protein [unclassified Flavobacterium]|uniref:DUF4365 domain-containing protein n=1 Tax=unclassified Flavobacterium TaxID=196869 RepID=UPI00095E65A1|nr:MULTISPECIES: DUF4365 domain-containing protein [unclassified Flavobacterium]MBN9285568.1 DUF4365 domain-containing protein [Flavobacterium sp.]OJV71074.1 MAG: hypothetical protein BGO42_04465 [Flavobacterium sp. 40-81]
MDFPKRIKQHKSQSDSFAILLYKLKDLGIFRSATENDYGIDFEIEIVIKDKVIGRYLKGQVKSAEDLYIRADKKPTVGGIKQTTLLYWSELSYRTHVIVFAIDLTTEKIYFTKSIFWQAINLLDGSDKTKTIEFLPAIDFSTEFKGKTIEEVKKQEKTENFISTLLIQKIAFESGLVDILYAHKTTLRNIKSIYELYTDTWHYDAWTEVQSLDIFKITLECAKILIDTIPENDLTEEENKNLFNFEYWARITDWSWDDVSNEVAKKPLKIILPLILDKMQYYSNLVLASAYYWINKDMPYLKLVFKTSIPSERAHEKIAHVDYRYEDFENKEHFDLFIHEIIEKNKKLKNEDGSS